MVGATLPQACQAAAYTLENAETSKHSVQILYLAVYSCGHHETADIDECAAREYVSMDSAFCRELVRRVPDLGLERGWSVTGFAGEKVLLDRDGVRAYVPRTTLPGEVEPGSSPAIPVPAVRPGRVPGFVVRSGMELSDYGSMSRLYLNVGPDDAAWALGTLARALEGAAIRYDVKVLAHQAAYDRSDSCVLYLRSEDAPRVLELVAGELRRSGVRLRTRTPLLTWRVAPGVAFADEPSDVAPGQSHGQWVSGLLLEAATATRIPDEILAHLTAAIRRSGRDPRTPFLRGDRNHAFGDLSAAAAVFGTQDVAAADIEAHRGDSGAGR